MKYRSYARKSALLSYACIIYNIETGLPRVVFDRKGHTIYR